MASSYLPKTAARTRSEAPEARPRLVFVPGSSVALGCELAKAVQWIGENEKSGLPEK